MKTNETCGYCKWNLQEDNCMHCHHPDRIEYKKIKKPCEYCGRKPKQESNGCGACTGRGLYTYPELYDQCDCKGFEILYRYEIANDL